MAKMDGRSGGSRNGVPRMVLGCAFAQTHFVVRSCALICSAATRALSGLLLLHLFLWHGPLGGRAIFSSS